MTFTPTTQYYNKTTHELQDSVPVGEHEALRRTLRNTRYQLTQARAENATLKRELKRVRGLARKMLEDTSAKPPT